MAIIHASHIQACPSKTKLQTGNLVGVKL